MNRWTISILYLLLGLLSLGVYPVEGAKFEVNTNLQEDLKISIQNNALSFPKAPIGQNSEEQKIIAVVQGNVPYQLFIQATPLMADGLNQLPSSVLEFKEKTENDWLPTSETLVPVLTEPAIANEEGDQKEINFRLNIPPSAVPGIYNGEMTIIVLPAIM